MITTAMVFATAMSFTAEISTSMKLSAVAASTVTVSAIAFTAESVASTVAAEVATIREPFHADSSAAMEIPVTTEVVAATEPLTVEVVAVMEPFGTKIIAIMEVTEQSVTLVDVRMPVVEVIPGTDADEHAIHKIIRAPVAVGRATKRIIRIISVCADRGRIVITVIRANLDADRNLRLGIDCRYR